MPWKLVADPSIYIFDWLIGYSALLGPIAGIMIVDYWVLRRRQLDVPDLFRPHGRYAGVNLSAVVALVVGILPNVPGFLQQAHVLASVPAWLHTLYTYAWFTGFGIAGLVYFLLESNLRRASAAPA
jgi:NCS1 family nucleobase:cation symporter-1